MLSQREAESPSRLDIPEHSVCGNPFSVRWNQQIELVHGKQILNRITCSPEALRIETRTRRIRWLVVRKLTSSGPVGSFHLLPLVAGRHQQWLMAAFVGYRIAASPIPGLIEKKMNYEQLTFEIALKSYWIGLFTGKFWEWKLPKGWNGLFQSVAVSKSPSRCVCYELIKENTSIWAGASQSFQSVAISKHNLCPAKR